ncbi:hypothetical protein HRR83_004447 [Exophiala dermatitidis]|uniref:Uncharacterized protein n=2 Tax=Exophiala dermatitidis TaxID=5970 RepID=H6BQI5_EXODN|nr:uncharacterized protein HMPREF1120_01984 [Exophiala dermatitidis NIH/UT8656]KAJ4515834.1 hypothetical protein HRR75_003916 [Exophiala dermatitidis]EHY53801.1 hypothetical protein HMPREF1120_01984 [Exophiala dermatitidis NIH/UT8656]KAJ4519529.1 hypothetical protein HRR74_004273 [Exophiala dermatitidis]KAJ4529347.1 hypothetical protein HRR73_000370 [Exophiala dermatitidis]KAJ4543999.1 hypothetical protein HRR76_002074 [Exophiala dermatitidis]
MIRLPPSSITLSESDVEFHLRQAEIYHGLLRQGFKKQEIIHYLADHRRALAEAAGGSLEDEMLPAPGTVELACRRSQSPQDTDDMAQRGKVPRKSRHPSSSESEGLPPCRKGRRSTDPAEASEEDDELGVYSPEGRSVSPVSLVPAMQVNKHAPRKSSLLRFATAASREGSPVKAEASESKSVSFASSRPMGRRNRSSGLQEPYNYPRLHDSVIEEMRQISLDSAHAQRGSTSETSDDLPFLRPAPFSATPRICSSQSVPTTCQNSSPNNTDDPARQASSTPSLPGWAHLRSPTPSSGEDIPSSPLFSASPAEELGNFDNPSSSSGLPATPSPVRRAPAYPRTEPRQHRHRYLDGNSFSVYNESLPAATQPQTPADLARGLFITEHDAAYTVPPGRPLPGPATVSVTEGQRWDQDAGEQSPVVRAIGLRERRNRELQRSVRVEGMRLRRLVMREEAVFTQQATETQQGGAIAGGGDNATRARNTPRPRLFQAMMDDIWRDDLDADRVGEENFEGDAENSRGGIMRVVSGNARFEG